jgi:hypothetical protein
MDRESLFGHVAFGIDVTVKFAAGRDVVNELDAGDLDDAMTFAWIQTGRFGIEHDFTQRSFPLLRRILTIAFKRRKVRPRPAPVGTTKSARWRFR